MATVTKDFKVKNGIKVQGDANIDGSLYVGGPNATVDGSDIITEQALLAGNGDGNLNVTVGYDAVTKKVTFEAAPGYTDADARNAISSGDGLDYDSATGVVSAQLGTGGGLGINTGGGISIDRTTVDTWYDASGAASTVAGDLSTHISDTSAHGVTGDVVGTTDAQTLTNKTFGTGTQFSSDLDLNGNKVVDLGTPTAGTDATNKTYVDGKASEVDTAAQGYASAAEIAAKGYADGIVATAVGNLEDYADAAATAAETSAKAYADGLSSGLTWKQAVNLLVTSDVIITGDFVGSEFDGHSALDITDAGYRLLLIGQDIASENGIYELVVDGTALILQRSADADTAEELKGAALFVQEGTQYGATAWVQSNHYLTSFAGQTWSQFSGQGTYLAGNGLTLDGNTFEIDTTITATKSYADSAAAGAVTTANAYTDAEITDALGIAQGYADTAESNANSYTNTEISALNTDDIEETAGATNLYFTDARAVTALESVTPNFVEIEYNSVAKQVASTVGAFATLPTVAYSFAKSEYRSAEFLIKLAYGTHTEVSKVVVTLDTSDNVAITEYAIVGTNGSLSSISATVNGGNVELSVTPNSDASVVLVGTLLA